MKLRLVVEKDSATGRRASYFPEIPGCVSAGDSEEEAIAKPTPLNLPEEAKVVEVAVS